MVLLSSRLPFDASVEEQRNLPPMVMSNEFAPELELPTVHIDNLTAAFNAVNYLHELGHQRIGCIAGPEDMPLCHYRLQGYVQALRRSGITVDPHYIARGTLLLKPGPTRWSNCWRSRCRRPRYFAIATLWRWAHCRWPTSRPEGAGRFIDCWV